MSFFTLTVSDIVKETEDASSIYFNVPLGMDKAFRYTSGQFVSLELKIDNQKVIRSYSLSSNPENLDLRITVKKIPNGVVSNYLVDQLKVGDQVEVSKPLGLFMAQKKAEGFNHVLFAAGSGIGPIASMAHELLNKTNDKVSLYYSSRNEHSIILGKELTDLVNQYSGRFKLVNYLSQAKNDGDFIKARMTPEIALEILNQYDKQKTHVYMCGPDGYMDRLLISLKDLNFNGDNIHKESFTTNTDEDADGVFIGDLNSKGTPDKLVVELNGKTIELKADPEKTIIDLLLDDDQDPPFSCMGGHCMACIAKVETGLVVQDDEGILTEENIQDKENLTCQSKCASPNIKIVFEDAF